MVVIVSHGGWEKRLCWRECSLSGLKGLRSTAAVVMTSVDIVGSGSGGGATRRRRRMERHGMQGIRQRIRPKRCG